MKKDIKSNVIFNNFSWLLMNKIINIGAGLISSVVVTRYLGSVNNGILSYAISYCALFSAVAAMGAENFVTKEFAKGEEQSGTVAGTAFFMLSLGSIVAFFLTNMSAAFFHLKEYQTYIFILSLQFITKPLAVFQYWFIGRSKAKYYAIAQNLVHIGCLALKIVLMLCNQSLMSFVVITTVEYMILEIGLFVAYIVGKEKFNRVRVCFNKFKKYFKICAPLIFSAIAITAYMKFDQIMIGSMLGDRELGIYSVAVKLAEYWYFMPLIIYNAVFPSLAKKFVSSPEKYESSLQLFSDIQGVVGIIAALMITLFSKVGIYVLYGNEFLEAAPILAIYCWAGLFVGLSYVKVVHCTNCNITGFQMISTCVGAGVNIALNAVLIPKVGASGAAWATVIAQFISSTFMCITYKPLRKIGVMQMKSLFPYVRLLKWKRMRLERNKNEASN